MRKNKTILRVGKKIKYGDGYNSRLIHNSIGLAYTVCNDCMEKENDSRRNEGRESSGKEAWMPLPEPYRKEP